MPTLATPRSRRRKETARAAPAAPASPPTTIVESVEAAKGANLRYVTDEKPGVTRKRIGKNKFNYLDINGKVIRDADTLARIRALVIPPAWTDVWVCPSQNGHLQATGRDARGRKQ
jgi:DNA topoisomerase-1